MSFQSSRKPEDYRYKPDLRSPRDARRVGQISPEPSAPGLITPAPRMPAQIVWSVIVKVVTAIATMLGFIIALSFLFL